MFFNRVVSASVIQVRSTIYKNGNSVQTNMMELAL